MFLEMGKQKTGKKKKTSKIVKNMVIFKKALPHPDIFSCCLNGIGAQKNLPQKVLLTLFPYIFHVKSK